MTCALGPRYISDGYMDSWHQGYVPGLLSDGMREPLRVES